MENSSSQSGMSFPLYLTQKSAHFWPIKYVPNIFLHWAQFRMQTPSQFVQRDIRKGYNILATILNWWRNHNVVIYLPIFRSASIVDVVKQRTAKIMTSSTIIRFEFNMTETNVSVNSLAAKGLIFERCTSSNYWDIGSKSVVTFSMNNRLDTLISL